MVHRDPQTGRFQAGSGPIDWGDVETVPFILTTEIPAADLGGGTGTVRVDGTQVQVVDMDEHIDADEEYRVFALWWDAYLSMPTTATAEGYSTVSYALSPDSEDFIPQVISPLFFGGAPDDEQGVVDIQQDEALHPVWVTGELQATPSIADSTNQLGAGSDHDTVREWFQFGPDGPRLEDQDELYIPHEWHFDNISDHAVIAVFRGTLYGTKARVD